jgi:hypothetical protein
MPPGVCLIHNRSTALLVLPAEHKISAVKRNILRFELVVSLLNEGAVARSTVKTDSARAGLNKRLIQLAVCDLQLLMAGKRSTGYRALLYDEAGKFPG